MKKHLEVKTIEHKGINVAVSIDYDEGTASLVEILHANGNVQTPPKKWVFANRTLDYVNSWLTIIEAMSIAVKECKKDLEHDLAEKSKFNDREIVKVFEVGSKLHYSNKKTNRKKKYD
jgi:hypothetical protein